MGEDDKALELGNVTFCSLTEEPPEVLPEPAHIDVHRFLEPHECTFEVSRESVRDILFNIMRCYWIQTDARAGVTLNGVTIGFNCYWG